MKKKNYFGYFFLTLFGILSILSAGCSNENTGNSNYRFEFDFDLNNHYSIEETDELFKTDRAYIDTNYEEWAKNFIHLHDGEIGDSLELGCWGNWLGYIQNPSASVKIWFPQTNLDDGIYQYSKKDDLNDFSIRIEKNMQWGEYVNSWGTFEGSNTILNSDVVASAWNASNNSVVVEYAEIKLENINTSNSEIRYVIETSNGHLIKGSFIGSLEDFKLSTPEINCD